MATMAHLRLPGARVAQLCLRTGCRRVFSAAPVPSGPAAAVVTCRLDRSCRPALHALCRPAAVGPPACRRGDRPCGRPMSTETSGSRDLMEFPRILVPNLIKMAKSMFLTWFVIRPAMDQTFTLEHFLEGARQAVLVISERLAAGDLAGLRGLVTTEALTELEANYASLSVKERTGLRVGRDDIGPMFPYEVGIIIEEEEGGVQKRWVEITVCAHVHPSFRGQMVEPSVSSYNLADLTVCNYRFIRNYTKGVQDSWTVNIINHFKPNQAQNG